LNSTNSGMKPMMLHCLLQVRK